MEAEALHPVLFLSPEMFQDSDSKEMLQNSDSNELLQNSDTNEIFQDSDSKFPTVILDSLPTGQA